jgi:hypothetical protein|tara:strand:- start:258 stop:425 length:168 start_codon:yes stop_codon:yes gene_type:complete
MSWFDAFLNAAVMSFFLGWMFFDEGDTLVETEGIDWDGDTGCEVEDYEWEYLDEA